MQEEVLERINTDETDRDWNKFHESESNSGNGKSRPSPKQKSYIISLAKTVGIEIDLSKVDDKQKASGMIEKLKTMSREKNVSQNGFELRDKRIAFGMATKLVFKKYLDRHKEIRKSKKFWQEVEEFYKEYQKRQESVVSSTIPNGEVV